MAFRTHSLCKHGIAGTWQEASDYLKGAPPKLKARVDKVFKSVVAMIETKNVCPFHAEELPDPVAATKKKRPTRKAT